MTSENIADNILTRINKRVLAVSGRLSGQYKGVKPFDAQKLKPEDQLYWYEQLGAADMDYLIEKHGVDAVNQFIGESEEIKRRRSKNG